MKKLLLKLINGNNAEWGRISLLLGIGFCTGIFVATYDIAVTALFLDIFDEEKDLPRATIAAGLAGIFSTLLFSTLQRYFGFRRTSLTILSLAAIGLALIAFILNYGVAEPTMVFTAFVALGPLNAIIILMFWILFGRLFSVRVAKRLSGGIDTGQAIATIFAFFAIPPVQTYLLESTELLYISFISVVGCLLLYSIIYRRFQLQEKDATRTDLLHQNENTRWVGQRRYVLLMALFVICSVMAARFINYSFLTVTDARFDAADSVGRNNFLAFFSGTIMITSFAVQTFLNDKIIEIYGLRGSLLLLPGILIIFGLASTFVGSYFGYTNDSETFLFFFLLVILSKLITDALRDSLESPTIKIFFFPLHESVRYDIQTKIEGFVKESATLLAGLLMTFITSFAFYNIIFNNYILFIIILGWGIVTYQLYHMYRSALTTSLQAQKNPQERILQTEQLSVQKTLMNQFEASENEQVQLALLRIMEQVDPFLFRSNLLSFALLDAEKMQMEALTTILDLKLFDAIRTLRIFSKVTDNPHLLEYAHLVLEALKESKKQGKSPQKIVELASSQYAQDRFDALRYLDDNYGPDAFQILVLLLRDLSPKVRTEALLVAGRNKELDALAIVIEHQAIPTYESAANSALVLYGKHALHPLEVNFYKNGQSQRVMVDIIEIYGRIGGQEAIQLLLDKIEYPDKLIVYRVFRALYNSGWQADETYRVYVKDALMEEAAKLIWNEAALTEIRNDSYHTLLQTALEDELSENLNRIFLYLALLYDRLSVQLVKENLIGGTPDSIGYALELLDIFIEEDLKRKFIPLLDDISTSDKLRKLESDFPREPFSSLEVLIQIINRDINQISRWTKACALYAYAHTQGSTICPDLIAQLFNTDPLLHEMAAWALEALSPGETAKYTHRVPHQVQDHLQYAWKQNPTPEAFLEQTEFNRIRVLFELEIFKGLNGTELSEIADGIRTIYLKSGEQYQSETKKEKTAFVWVVHSGSLQVVNDLTSEISHFYAKQLCTSFMLDFPPKDARIVAEDDTVVWQMDTVTFYKVLGSRAEFAEKIIGNITAYVTNKEEVSSHSEAAALN